MVWSTPTVQGIIPTPRAGHAGVTAGENWFIVGGGDNKNGITETVVLNMNTFTWSVLTTVDRHSPPASEGLSLVLCSLNGDDVLIAFGGYNGRYSNEVHVLKPRQKSSLPSEMDAPAKDSITPLPTTDAMRTKAGKIHGTVMNYPENNGIDENGEKLIISTLNAEKESLEAALSKEQLLTLLQQEVAEAETEFRAHPGKSFMELYESNKAPGTVETLSLLLACLQTWICMNKALETNRKLSLMLDCLVFCRSFSHFEVSLPPNSQDASSWRFVLTNI